MTKPNELLEYLGSKIWNFLERIIDAKIELEMEEYNNSPEHIALQKSIDYHKQELIKHYCCSGNHKYCNHYEQIRSNPNWKTTCPITNEKDCPNIK